MKNEAKLAKAYELQKGQFEMARERKLVNLEQRKQQLEVKIANLRSQLSEVEAQISNTREGHFQSFDEYLQKVQQQSINASTKAHNA